MGFADVRQQGSKEEQQDEMMHLLRRATVAFLGGVLVFACNSMADEARFVHKDWDLVCDNTRTCRAAGYQADEDERLVSMLLTREAGPNTPVSMELQLVAGDEGGVPTEVRLQVGELLFSNIAVGEELPQETAAKLLAVMPDEEKMILTADGQQWKLSLAGLKAVLLKMDDKQGRIGTPGTLAAKGNKPEQQVLPPVPIRTLTVPQLPPTKKRDKILPTALKKFFDSKCDWNWGACEQRRSVNRLNKEKLIVIQPSIIGTRNMAYHVFIINNKPPYNPKPAIRSEDGLLYDASETIDRFSYKNIGVLHVSELHIGSVNDSNSRQCASSHDISWAWTGETFEKAEESISGMCSFAWNLPIFVSKIVNKNDKVKKWIYLYVTNIVRYISSQLFFCVSLY